MTANNYKYLLYVYLISISLYCNALSANDFFQNAPCWVTNSSCINEKNVAIGLSKTIYSDNPQLATFQSKKNALINLSLSLKVNVSSVVTQTANKLSNQKNEWIFLNQQRYSVSSVNELNGVRFIGKWIDENGILYTLAAMDTHIKPSHNKPLDVVKKHAAIDSSELYIESIRVNMDYAQNLSQNISKGVQTFLH